MHFLPQFYCALFRLKTLLLATNTTRKGSYGHGSGVYNRIGIDNNSKAYSDSYSKSYATGGTAYGGKAFAQGGQGGNAAIEKGAIQFNRGAVQGGAGGSLNMQPGSVQGGQGGNGYGGQGGANTGGNSYTNVSGVGNTSINTPRQTPLAYSPGMAMSFSQQNCANSVSLGVSAPFGAIGGGVPIDSDECNRRADSVRWQEMSNGSGCLPAHVSRFKTRIKKR